MVSCALGSTGYGAPASFPAYCLLHPPTMTQGLEEAPAYGHVQYNAAYIAIALAFLMVSYLTRIIQLFPKATDTVRTTFRTRPSNALKRCLSQSRDRVSCPFGRWDKTWSIVVHQSLLSIYCLLKVAADLYGSVLWEVCCCSLFSAGILLADGRQITWLALALAWGTICVLRDRGSEDSSIGNLTSLVDQEDAWGFGQVISVMLLALPIVSFSEVIYSKLAILPSFTY